MLVRGRRQIPLSRLRQGTKLRKTALAKLNHGPADTLGREPGTETAGSEINARSDDKHGVQGKLQVDETVRQADAKGAKF